MIQINFQIVTDTSANLPREILDRYGLVVLPFTFTVDGREQTCLDAGVFDGHGFYQAMRNHAEVSTSQINPDQYLRCFEPLLAQGTDVLFISMSSGISGSYASSQLAAGLLAEQFPERRIETFDTLGASLGEGLLVLRAAKLQARGASLDEILQDLTTHRSQMYQVFTVEDLHYLQKGGRLTKTSALVGTVLQIKPLLKGNRDGEIVLRGKVRGRKASIRALAAAYADLAEQTEEQIVGIAHADCPEEAAQLADLLRAAKPPREILTVCYEPVTGSHVGPGTIALFFESFPGVRLV